jgi:MFS family permease
VPIYLSEISPPAIQGRIGVLNQLGIVIGIFAASAFGLGLATPSTWRWVLFISSCVACVQLVCSLIVVESPSWLRAQGRTEEATKVAGKLWTVSKVLDPGAYLISLLLLHDLKFPNLEEREALLESEVEAHVPEEAVDDGQHRPAINVPTLVASSDLYRPMALVLVAMFVQQASGINAGKCFPLHMHRCPDLVCSHVLQQRYPFERCTTGGGRLYFSGHYCLERHYDVPSNLLGGRK